jgi:hypothetical protein
MNKTIYCKNIMNFPKVIFSKISLFLLLCSVLSSSSGQINSKKITAIRIGIDTNLINSNYIIPGDTIPVDFIYKMKNDKEKYAVIDKSKGVNTSISGGQLYIKRTSNSESYYIVVPRNTADTPDGKIILKVSPAKRPELQDTLEINLSYPDNISKLEITESSPANILPGTEIKVWPQITTKSGRVLTIIGDRTDLLKVNTISGAFEDGVFTIYGNLKYIIDDRAMVKMVLADSASIGDSAIIEINYRGTQAVYRNGYPGVNGTAGESRTGLLNGENGYAGGDGTTGTDGSSAADYYIYVYAYQSRFMGDTLLNIKITNAGGQEIGNYVVNTNGGILEFHAIGGTGGTGGNGGDGQNGKDAKNDAGLFKVDRDGVSGGNGGNGGSGGNGGNGGNVFLFLDPSTQTHQNNFKFILYGGNGGYGGSGGSGGSGGDGIKTADGESWELQPGVDGQSGSSGSSGTSGTAGTVTVKIKSLK